MQAINAVEHGFLNWVHFNSNIMKYYNNLK